MIYLDNSATTRVDDDIAATAVKMMTDCFGNPSSLHHFGMDAYEYLMDARYQAASVISVPTSTVFFTSGGTESNNIAIRGAATANRKNGCHIVTTAIEHSSVLGCCAALEKEGFEVSYVKPDPATHRIKAADIADAVRDDTVLVSVMHVNNETGEILPVAETADLVHKKNEHTLIHCDAVQSFGKIPVHIYELKADILSASGHKIHAPKGVGMLYIREGCNVTPLEYGGSQEGKINPGTEGVPLSCAFGAAAAKRKYLMKEAYKKVSALNRYCREKLSETFPEVLFNSPENASPYVLNFSLPGRLSGDMVDALSMRDIYISAGSACSRGAVSHVLIAAGYEDERINSALRVSFTEENTCDEIDRLIEALREVTR